MKKGLILLAGISLSLLTACKDSGPQEKVLPVRQIGKEVVIGGNLELSGSAAAYGNIELDGAKLAVKEINEKGGIGKKKIRFVYKDNKSENAESAAVALNLIVNSKVVAIVGTTTSNTLQAMTPIVNRFQIPTITPSGTADALTLRKNGKVQPSIFRSCFQNSFQGKVIATYATNNLHTKNVILFKDVSAEYSQGIANAFVKNYSGKIVQTINYTGGDKDFQAQLTKIKNKKFDAMIITGYYAEAGLVIKQAREKGIEQPILGGDGFSDEKLVETAGKKNIRNIFYSDHFSLKAPATKKVKPFAKNFKKEYGKEASTFAALSYDCVYMIKQAIESTHAKDSTDITKGLAKLKNFQGVTGVMTMKNHNPEKSAIVVGLTGDQETSVVTVNAK